MSAESANSIAKINSISLCELLMKHSNDGFHMLDNSGKLVAASDSFFELLGYQKGELLGHLVTEWDLTFWTENSPQQVLQKFGISEEKICAETRQKRKDGQSISVELVFTPINLPEGQFICCSARNITKRKSNEQEYQELVHFSKIVIDNSPVGVAVYEIAGPCVMVNQAMTEFLHAKKEDLAAQNFRELKSWRDSGLFECVIDAYESKKRVQRDVDVTTSLGVKLHLSCSVELVKIGIKEFVVCHFQDLTEKIRDNQRMLEQQKTLQAIFDYAPLPFLFFDYNGIVDCNFAAVKIFGFKKKNELLWRHPSFFSPEFQPDGSTSFAKGHEMDRLTREQGLHVFEWNHRRTDGVEFPVECTMVPLNLGGRSILMAVLRDLTVIRENERRLVESSKMAALGEMSAGIAHEINNPLMVVMAKVSNIQKRMAAESLDKQKILDDVAKVQITAERIARIIRGLKNFSRGADLDPMSPVKIQQIVNETIDLCRERLNISSVELRLNFQTDAFLECRSTQISQVLVNLLGNAIDAIETFDEKWVAVDVTETVEDIFIQVTDSGHGIPEAIVKKIMQPFFTTKPAGKGTGLGLSLSKGIIEAHSGSLSYDFNCPNTRFVLKIPKHQPMTNNKPSKISA